MKVGVVSLGEDPLSKLKCTVAVQVVVEVEIALSDVKQIRERLEPAPVVLVIPEEMFDARERTALVERVTRVRHDANEPSAGLQDPMPFEDGRDWIVEMFEDMTRNHEVQGR